MPQLINYLDRLPPGRSFDEFELAALQRVYDRARAVLGVEVDDPRRERVALLVFDLADHASGDALLERVVAAFRHLG
jgi:hypothetical protein